MMAQFEEKLQELKALKLYEIITLIHKVDLLVAHYKTGKGSTADIDGINIYLKNIHDLVKKIDPAVYALTPLTIVTPESIDELVFGRNGRIAWLMRNISAEIKRNYFEKSQELSQQVTSNANELEKISATWQLLLNEKNVVQPINPDFMVTPLIYWNEQSNYHRLAAEHFNTGVALQARNDCNELIAITNTIYTKYSHTDPANFRKDAQSYRNSLIIHEKKLAAIKTYELTTHAEIIKYRTALEALLNAIDSEHITWTVLTRWQQVQTDHLVHQKNKEHARILITEMTVR